MFSCRPGETLRLNRPRPRGRATPGTQQRASRPIRIWTFLQMIPHLISSLYYLPTYTRSSFMICFIELNPMLHFFFFAANPIHSLSLCLTMICKMTIFTYVQCIHHSWRPFCEFFFYDNLLFTFTNIIGSSFLLFFLSSWNSFVSFFAFSCCRIVFSTFFFRLSLVITFFLVFLMTCCSIAFGKDSLDDFMFKFF